MSNTPDHNQAGRAQLRADLPPDEHEPLEQEAVRTTIVGGRPPGSGKPMGSVPRGIEVLLKKAAIDPQFRELLLKEPEAAALSIELELTPVEQLMLQSIPAEHLTAIIDQTEVPQQQRRAFLGTAAAAMLAVLTGFVTGCPESPSKGSRPDGWTGGANPDMPYPLTAGEGGAAPDIPWTTEDDSDTPPSAGTMPDVPDQK